LKVGPKVSVKASGEGAAREGAKVRAATAAAVKQVGGPDGLGGPGSPVAAPTAQDIELILRKLEELPTLSTVATRVMNLTSDAEADIDEIISLLEADPALSGRLLSLCRRASLGVSQSVTTVRRAVTLLGLEAVQSAVLSTQIYEVMVQSSLAGERREGEGGTADGQNVGFDRTGFWKHSVAVASCAELLVAENRVLKLKPDEAFTCGLIHDIGKLVLDWTLPRTYGKVIALAEAKSANLAAVERAVIGLDHQAVGKRLAEHWGLPHILTDVVWLHGSSPAAVADVRYRPMILLVTLADAMCRRLHLGWSGSCEAPPVLAEFCDALDLPVSALARIESQLHEAVARRCTDLGLGESSSSELIVQSITAANGKLSRLSMACAQRGEQVRLLQRASDAVVRFAAADMPAAGSVGTSAGGVSSAARRVIESFCAVAGPGPCYLVWQARSGEGHDARNGWKLFSLPSGDAATVAVGDDGPAEAACCAAMPPQQPGGEPLDLAEIAAGGGSALGATVGLLTWLSEHAPECPDLRTLRIVRLVCGGGPAAVLVHDRAGPGLAEVPESLRCVWAAALVSSGQHEGLRRMSDTLAQTGRKLEQLQRELAESESFARLGELTAGAAHELNNPLTVINGRSQLLTAKLTEPTLRGHAEAIVEASGRLTDIITRLHAVTQDSNFKPVSLSVKDVVADAVKKASERFVVKNPKLMKPGVRLSFNRADRAILADKHAVSDALSEVILNAMEAVPRTGVAISTDVDPAAAVIRLQISDDGRGMNEHAVLHAFDAFFSEKPAGRSTGLGLTLARRLISGHGGTVRLRSRLGEGTTATVELPAHMPSAGRPGAPLHVDLGASASAKAA